MVFFKPKSFKKMKTEIALSEQVWLQTERFTSFPPAKAPILSCVLRHAGLNGKSADQLL